MHSNTLTSRTICAVICSADQKENVGLISDPYLKIVVQIYFENLFHVIIYCSLSGTELTVEEHTEHVRRNKQDFVLVFDV